MGRNNRANRRTNRPDDSDITTQDYESFWYEGKEIISLERDVDEKEAAQAVLDWMEKNNYNPNVWYIGERGDANLLIVKKTGFAYAR